jgi:hypothetical protein
MPARRFATPLFCGVLALASAEFSGNALAQTAPSDGAHARDVCGAASCEWTGVADVVSTGALRLAPFGWRPNALSSRDDASDKSNDGNFGDAVGRSKAGIAAGLGVVGAAALVVARDGGSDPIGRVASASSGPAIGAPITAATLTDAVTTTPEPAAVVLIATGLVLLIPIARAIRSR